MKRDIYQKLIDWSQSKFRKPLILRGARQTGKTFVLSEFGENEYENVIYLNFDETPGLAALFKEDLDPVRIIEDLSLHFKQRILPEKTLIIFDEVQECENALNCLKYFCEKKNEYHVAAAGSLLGVKLAGGFPVGKVNFLDLYPLSFFEFLDAMDETALRKKIQCSVQSKPINDLFHKRLLKLLKQYFVIGGMPEVVRGYLKSRDYGKVRQLQDEVLDAYLLDFSKHAPANEVMKIMTVWQNIPEQLSKENKKFIFSAMSQSARAREYETAIQWLVKAGMIVQAFQLKGPKLPLSANKNTKSFKVYFLDVGLLGAFNKLEPKIILQGDALFKEFKGALTENYVAQTFLAEGNKELYYWSSQGKAEVNFVLEYSGKIYPVEVKSGTSKQKKSLKVYFDQYLKDVDTAYPLVRSSLLNFAADGRLVNYPLYAVSLVPKLNDEEASK